MTRVVLAALALVFSAIGTSASPWPSFPQHPFPVDAEDVKAYWLQALPRPEKPRHTHSSYIQLNVYHQAVSTGRSLVRRLQAGFFDREAHLTALRHNLAYYQHKDLQLWIETTEDAIAIAEAGLLLPPALPAANAVERRPTRLRTTSLSLGRLDSSGGLQPRRPARPTPRPAAGPAHSWNPEPEPVEPQIIYIEEDADDSQDSRDCPPSPPRPRPPRPSPPLEIQPWSQMDEPPSPPQPKPSAPPPSSRPSAPTRANSTSFFNQSGRRSR